MTLFHISLEVEEVINAFTPRLPSATYEYEDTKIPRISLSDSIEGCLSAVPWGGRKLENVISSFEDVITNGEDYYPTLVFRIYEFDRTQIKEGNLYSPDKLVEDGLVMDAINSNEHWVINQDIVPTKTYFVVLSDYYDQIADVFSKEYYHLDEDEEDLDIEDFIIGASTKIENIEIERYNNIEKIPYRVDWDKWKNERNKLKENNYEDMFF